MPLSEDARNQLEKWLDDADRRLWMRQEDRRSARATRNIALIGVVITVLAVFGGPALVDKMTNDAVNEAARRVTVQITGETEKLEERAKTALADAEVASKVVLERSQRAEQNSKEAIDTANTINEEIERLSAKLTEKAQKLDDRLAAIDADSSNLRQTIEIEIAALNKQLKAVGKATGTATATALAEAQRSVKPSLDSFKEKSQYLLNIVSSSLSAGEQPAEDLPTAMSLRESLEPLGYRVALSRGSNRLLRDQASENPGRGMYVRVDGNPAARGIMEDIASHISTQFDTAHVTLRDLLFYKEGDIGVVLAEGRAEE